MLTTNEDNNYYTLTLKSNSENYKFEKEEYIYVHIPKIKINFKLVEKYFEGGDIFYDLSSNIELIENDDLYSIQINDNYLTNNLKKDITLSIEELSEGDINDFNGITKELSLDNVKKLVKLKVITIVLRENGKILNINDNISFYNNNEMISDDIEIIRFKPFDEFNIIPNEITVSYLDELTIAEDTLGFTYYSSSGKLPLNISYSFTHSKIDIDENSYNSISNMSFDIGIDGSVELNYLKNSISYDLTNVLYNEIIINSLKVKVEKANISITTKSGSKTIDCDWNDELFDESLLNIPNKYSDLIYSIEFENTEANEVGTYSNSISINEEFYDFYNITFVFGTLTVYPKKTQIIASNTSISYGTPFVMSSAISYYGDSLEEDVTDNLLLYYIKDIDSNKVEVSDDKFSSLPVGTYIISIDESALDDQKGYEIDFYEGTLEVTPFEITLIPQSYTTTYSGNAANISNDITYSEVYTGSLPDDWSTVSNGINVKLNDENNDEYINAGTYPNAIIIDGISSNANYIINKRTADLTINKFEITLIPQSYTITYSGNAATFSDDITYSEIYTGSLPADWPNVSNGINVKLNDEYNDEYINAGTYSNAIIIDGISSNNNYIVNKRKADLTINKFEITLIPQSYTTTYSGNAATISDDITYSEKYTGLLPTDWEDVSSSIFVELKSGEYINAGIYPDAIIIDGISSNDNYIINKSTADLTINKFKITLTSKSYTKTYNGNAVTQNEIMSRGFNVIHPENEPEDLNDFLSQIVVINVLLSESCSEIGTYEDVISLAVMNTDSNYEVITQNGDIIIN